MPPGAQEIRDGADQDEPAARDDSPPPEEEDAFVLEVAAAAAAAEAAMLLGSKPWEFGSVGGTFPPAPPPN